MELALVLDNTGSMWGTPFTTMQAAAKDLVDIVYGDDGHQPEPVCSRRALRRYRQHGQLADRLAGSGRSGPGGQATPTPHRPGKAASWPAPAGSTRPTIRRRPPRSEAISIPMPPTMTGARRATRGPTSGSTRRTTPMAPISAAARPFYRWCREGRPSTRRWTAWAPGAAAAPRATRAWPGAGACFRRGGAGLWGGDTPNARPLDYDAADTDKVVVMLTDGNNEVYDWPCQWVAGQSSPDCGSDVHRPEWLRLHCLRSA